MGGNFSLKEVMGQRFDEQNKHLEDIKIDVKDALNQIKIQNGRVTRLEGWSKEAQKVIEHTTQIASETLSNYNTDRARIWTSIALIIFLGGTIITLALMVIDNKIKQGVDMAFESRFSEIELK